MRRNAVANRERILAAAEQVFGTRGRQGSTEEVARLAEVGIATVFRHFPTKEALLRATLVRHLVNLRAQADALSGQPDPAAALHRLVHTMVTTGATKIALAGLVGADGPIPDDVLAAAAELRGVVEGVLGRAQAAGSARPDVSVDDLYFLISGLAHAGAAARPATATVDRCVEVVLRGLTST